MTKTKGLGVTTKAFLVWKPPFVTDRSVECLPCLYYYQPALKYHCLECGIQNYKDISVMKKLITLAAVLSLVACGGDGGNSSDKISAVGGISVSETTFENDSEDSSQFVSLGSIITGSLGPADEFDFYKVNITEGESVTIRLLGALDTDIDVALIGPSFNVIASSESAFSTESLTFTASTSGEFYVRVEFFEGTDGGYELSIISNGFVDVSQGSNNASGTQFCVESIIGEESAHQVASGASTPTNNLQQGTCPSAGYVSVCNVNSSGVLINTYFSQGYVDVVGGHSEVERNVCDMFAVQSSTSNYNLL
jgi:hypothetical protein